MEERRSLREIGQIVGVSSSTVYRRMVEFGIIRRGPGRNGQFPSERIHHLRHHCRWTITRIADELQCSEATVRRYLRRQTIVLLLLGTVALYLLYDVLTPGGLI